MEKNKKQIRLRRLYEKYSEAFQGKELVFGDGNPDSGLVMIGEAPGKDEVRLGKPFVGLAGGKLKQFMDYLDLSRNDLYVTNAIKYRLFKINPITDKKSNRPAKSEEIKGSSVWLAMELDILSPSLIITLGNVPLRTLINDKGVSIGNCHGRLVTYMDMKVFPLYHPASLIYNRSLEDTYYEDLNKLKDLLKRRI